MGKGASQSNYLHIRSVRWSTAAANRSLCGLWNPPCVESKNGKKLPGQTCPACRRLQLGGKK